MNRSTQNLLLTGLAILLAWIPAHAQGVVCPATTDAEWELLIASSPQQATFIRTTADWNDYKAGARFVGHPLSGLTTQQLNSFAASVWIADGGVISMDTGVLKDNLQPAAYAYVLAAFGISTQLAEDHKDYECESRSNCKEKQKYICMSSC